MSQYLNKENFRLELNSVFFAEVYLLYNVVISAIQQSDSVLYIYIYIYTHTHTLFFIFFSIFVHRILNIVLSAIQQDLVAYPVHV